MTKNFSRDKAVCFSGHRPEKIPSQDDTLNIVTTALKSMIYTNSIDTINLGCNSFITGLARGVDLWAGEIIIELKNTGYDINLIAASPHKGHGENFEGYDKWLLGNILHNADEIVYVSEHYHKLCMKMRNEYMINNSAYLIAAVSDYKSGTGQTIRLAEKAGLKPLIINLNELVRSEEHRVGK